MSEQEKVALLENANYERLTKEMELLVVSSFPFTFTFFVHVPPLPFVKHSVKQTYTHYLSLSLNRSLSRSFLYVTIPLPAYRWEYTPPPPFTSRAKSLQTQLDLPFEQQRALETPDFESRFGITAAVAAAHALQEKLNITLQPGGCVGRPWTLSMAWLALLSLSKDRPASEAPGWVGTGRRGVRAVFMVEGRGNVCIEYFCRVA